ncbi:MAG: nitroreductase [Spirochaetes bacterium]|nr:MAG: nitroreductase [Spirochaetota bacterium]
MEDAQKGFAGTFFLRAMETRFACKRYAAKPLESDDIKYILECGRLSPSSFGLEPWTFCTIGNRELMESLGAACFGQEAVSSAALAVCILVEKEKAFEPGSDFLKQRSARFPGGYSVFLEDYRGYYEFLRSQDRILSWSRSQAYIAAANMMTGAKALGLDSCAIEGFAEGEVLGILGASAEEKTVGLIVVFGYGDETPREKIREPPEAIIRLIS